MILNELKKKNSKSNIKENIFKKKFSYSLENLFFKFEGANEYLFENLKFEIKNNEIIGIFGESGVGKSSLINLMSGLINPLKGKIKIDDILLKENEYHGLRYYL